jgi:hypothetical protein
MCVDSSIQLEYEQLTLLQNWIVLVTIKHMCCNHCRQIVFKLIVRPDEIVRVWCSVFPSRVRGVDVGVWGLGFMIVSEDLEFRG